MHRWRADSPVIRIILALLMIGIWQSGMAAAAERGELGQVSRGVIRIETSVAPRIAMAGVVQAGSAGAGEQQMLLRCLYLNSATGLIGLAAISAPGVRAPLPVLLDSRGRGANHSDCVRGQDVSWQITRSAEPHLSAGQQVVLLTPQ